MRKISILLTFMLMTFVGETVAQDGGEQTPKVIPVLAYNNAEFVYDEQPVAITYDINRSPLAGCDNVEGVIYLWKDYSWSAHDLKMSKKDTMWVSTFDVPKGTALCITVLKSGDKVDKGGKVTYASFVMDNKTRKEMPTSYIGWGMVRNPLMSQQYGIRNFCDSLNAIDNQIMFMWLNYEMRFNPQERPNTLKIAVELMAAQGAKDEELAKIIRGDADVMMANKASTESQLLSLSELVRGRLKDEPMAKKIDSLVLVRFPNGVLARDIETRRVNAITEEDLRISESIKLFERFPPAIFNHIESRAAKQYSDLIRMLVYMPIVKNKSHSGVYQYLSSTPQNLLMTYFWHLVQLPYRNKEFTAKQLEPIADIILKEALNRPNEGDNRMYSPKEWRKMFIENSAHAFLSYAMVINECGRREEAMEWAETIKPIYNNKDAEFNEFYMRLLQQNGFVSMVVPMIEASIKENAATPAMLDVLRKEYIAKNKSDKGFDKYVDAFKSEDVMSQQRKHIDESMVNSKIEPFKFTELSGNSVDMKSLKGKTIVIDFWSTWCAPCKAALPGMQMAVNKFKADKNVVFLFVATQEKPDGLTEKVKRYIAEKGYNDMNFVFDTMAKSGKLEAVYDRYAKAFGISGIPLKMVIDGNGNLRWYSVGYHGSPSALVDEISYVIERCR